MKNHVMRTLFCIIIIGNSAHAMQSPKQLARFCSARKKSGKQRDLQRERNKQEKKKQLELDLNPTSPKAKSPKGDSRLSPTI